MPPVPKPAPHKKHRPKNNPKPTIEDRCTYPGCCQGNAHLHEIFFGSLRQLSMRHGMQKRLCYDHHEGNLGPHQCREYDLQLKREAQAKFEAEIGDREEFRRIFGKSYL
jgi:hypothetical protein